MSKWTHAICNACWAVKHPGEVATALTSGKRGLEPCCWCGTLTDSGIYLREASETLRCKGNHS